MSSAKPAEQHEERHEAYIKNHAGLTSIPAKVMAMDLAVLDLSHNQIEVVPKGLFPDVDGLKQLKLSYNSIKSLPDDIAALKQLEVLHLAHNKLTALPDGLYSLIGVRDLDASYNKIDHIPDEIGQMEGLHVLGLAGNRLRALPCDIGWLGLKQLNISDNPDLNIPEHIFQGGFKAVTSYLQVVGEQHQLVSRHMALFTAKLRELQVKHGLTLGPLEDEASVAIRCKVAARFGILACSHCHLAALPAALLDGSDALKGSVQVLDLSYNRLKEAPQDLLQGLQKLLVANLSYNNIKIFPSNLSLASVAVLNLSFNKLTSLPDDLGIQLPGLQQLYMANNYLSSLPDSLEKTPLHDLFLSENNYDRVPAVLQRCRNLVKLSMAACKLTNIGNELDGAHSLRFLDVSFNKLKTLPSNISSLVGLERLNLGFNALTNFPDVLTSLTNLKELNFDYTGISSFPEGLGELRQLEGLQADGCPLTGPFAPLYAKEPLLLVKLHDTQLLSLDLSDTGLEDVPQQVMRMTQLTSLNLLKNAIKDLPQGLGDLRQLQELHLKGNPLRQPYVKIMDAKGELALPVFLRPEGNEGCVDLENCGFEALPKEVWDLPGRVQGLVELNLSNNRLRDLPSDLSTLTNLSQLTLDHNLLRHLPPVVLSLPSLSVLMASSNCITHLPDTISSAQHLQALILHSNELMQLPDSITTLTNLRALGLTSNRLWQLPAGLAACSGLRLLDCSHNLLSRLPNGLGKLQKLRSLKLTHNKLRWIPVSELQELPALAELHLAGNMVSAYVEMNASDIMSVQQLLSALADTSAGEAPSPQEALSRNTSNLSNDMVDSPKSFSPVRSRFADDSRASGSTGSLSAAGTKRGGVTWKDDSNGSNSSSSSFSTGSAVVPDERSGASQLRPNRSTGDSDRTSLDGSITSSHDDEVNPARVGTSGRAGAGSRPSVHFAGDDVAQPQPVQAKQQAHPKLQEPKQEPAASASPPKKRATEQQQPSPPTLPVLSSAAATSTVAEALGALRPTPAPVDPDASKPNITLQGFAAGAAAASPTAAAGSPAGKLTWAAALAQAGHPVSPSKPAEGNSGWDTIPLMDMPKLIKALTVEPPPPPQPESAAEHGQPVRRPQSKARFKRVIQQTTKAMELLEMMAAAGVGADDQPEPLLPGAAE